MCIALWRANATVTSPPPHTLLAQDMGQCSSARPKSEDSFQSNGQMEDARVLVKNLGQQVQGLSIKASNGP